MKSQFFSLFIVLIAYSPIINRDLHAQKKIFSNTNDLDPTPYLLPQNHEFRPILDQIFSNPNVLTNENTLHDSGFVTICIRLNSALQVVHHPAIKGYLYKVNLDEYCQGKRQACNNKLIQRCISAECIRKLIKMHKIRYFTVPQKWIYELPSSGQDGGARRLILIVEDMHCRNRKESRTAWKEKASKRHFEELFIILNNGYASLAIMQNIPYVGRGIFSCIDTEFPKRKFQLERLTKRLPRNKRRFWRRLVRNAKKTQPVVQAA